MHRDNSLIYTSLASLIIEFSNNINPAYLNGYKGGAYNIAITAFEIDGGAVGLFQYAKEQEWQEVFNKEKEGNPAKKFPTTRPFAIEQDFPDNSIPHDSDGVNKYSDRDSTEPRFDSNVQDAASNELRSDQEKPTVHSLLMETDASKVKNAIERKYLKEYRQTANRQLAEQQKLDKLQAELDALPKDNRQTSRARFLRDEIIKTKNRLQICQSIQTRLETDSPLTYLITREIKPRLAKVQKTTMPQIQTGVANLEQSDIINKQKRSVAYEITEDAIRNIPNMSYSGLTNEASQLLHEQQQLLLKKAMELPKGTEVAFICNLAGMRQWESVGSIGHSSVPEVTYEHLILHNHPDCRIFSGTDIETLIMRAETKGIFAIGNDGSVFSAIKQENYDGYAAYESFKAVNIELEKYVAAQNIEGYVSAIRKYLKEAKKFGIEFDEKAAGGT